MGLELNSSKFIQIHHCMVVFDGIGLHPLFFRRRADKKAVLFERLVEAGVSVGRRGAR